MQSVAVVYFSQTGTTAALAEAVSEGVESVAGVKARRLRIIGKDIVDGRYVNESTLVSIDHCQAIVFGSPTYMGGPAAQFKALADASSERWVGQSWRNKLAAGFTCGSSPAGDQLATLQYFSILSAQQGMHWINIDIAGDDPQGRNRLGTQLGLTAQASPDAVDASDLATAHYLGSRVANLIKHWPGLVPVSAQGGEAAS